MNSRTFLLLGAGWLACSPPGRAADDGMRLDSWRHAGPSSSRAWLLDMDSAPLPAAWPRTRQEWLDAPGTPRLAWLADSRPLADSCSAWPALALPGMRIWAGPRLSLSSWRAEQDSVGRLDEAGNGFDLEAIWPGRAAAWLHLEDSGTTGDLDWRGHPLFTEPEKWLWQEVQDDGSLTHDEERAGVCWETRQARGGLRVGIVRDQARTGSGLLRTTLLQGDRAPVWTQLVLQGDWGPLHYTQSVGELFSAEPDSTRRWDDGNGKVKTAWREKWLAVHRIDWTARWGGLGLTEVYVIGDRRPGLGAWLPAGLYWSDQRASGDRDNVLWGADLRLRLPEVLPGSWEAHGELTLDDYSLSDLGGDQEGQRSAWLAGLTGCPLPVAADGQAMRLGGWEVPGISWWTVELTRVRPYLYGHFYAANRYDHGGRSLGATEDPNSQALDWEWRHEAALPKLARGRLELAGLCEAAWRGGRLLHGANPPGTNVGGDRRLPHRDGVDPDVAPFLDGERETLLWNRIELSCALRAGWAGRPLGVLEITLGQAWSSSEQDGRRAMARATDWSLGWGAAF